MNKLIFIIWFDQHLRLNHPLREVKLILTNSLDSCPDLISVLVLGLSV